MATCCVSASFSKIDGCGGKVQGEKSEESSPRTIPTKTVESSGLGESAFASISWTETRFAFGSRLIVNNRIKYGSIDYNTIKPRGYLVALCVRNGTSNGRVRERTRSAEVPRRWVYWRGRHHSQSVSSGGKKTA
jgi:hypothetical protein